MLNRPCLFLTLYGPAGDIQSSVSGSSSFYFKNLIRGKWSEDSIVLSIPPSCSVSSEGKNIYSESELPPQEVVLHLENISKPLDINFKNSYRLRIEKRTTEIFDFNIMPLIVVGVLIIHFLSLQFLSFNFNSRKHSEQISRTRTIESVQLISNSLKSRELAANTSKMTNQMGGDSLFKKWGIKKNTVISQVQDSSDLINLKEEVGSQLSNLLTQKKNDIRECYSEAQIEAKRSVEAQFDFASDGRIKSISLSDMGINHRIFSECLKKALDQKLKIKDRNLGRESLKIAQTLIFNP